ncbi:Uncharacterised protein [Mycobacteroides abscessus subsp. abscessus]|nr:Uncharacterised protein [Mycobacteroides abscessus subsp. abscessus]
MKLRTKKLLRYAAEPDGSWEWAEQVLAISPQDEPRNIVTQQECLDALRRVAEMSRGPPAQTSSSHGAGRGSRPCTWQNLIIACPARQWAE